jgi:hypothetical protein
VRIALTALQKGDAPQAAALIEGLAAEASWPMPPMRPITCAKPSPQKGARRHPQQSVARSTSISTPNGHLIECCFSRRKHFRRVATRFEKTARNLLAIVTLAATVLWLR